MNRKGDYLVELSEYIKKNLKKGYTKESLKWALIGQGYSKIEVERALDITDKELASQAPILNLKPTIKHEIIPVIEEKKSFWKRMFG